MAGLSNSYYHSIMSQQQQMQLLMQLQTQEQIKKQQIVKALSTREAELILIGEELKRQKDETVYNIKTLAQQAIQQNTYEIRTDREDEVQHDLDQLRMDKEMSTKHQKELIYHDFDIQQQRLRQKAQCDNMSDRER